MFSNSQAERLYVPFSRTVGEAKHFVVHVVFQAVYNHDEHTFGSLSMFDALPVFLIDAIDDFFLSLSRRI